MINNILRYCIAFFMYLESKRTSKKTLFDDCRSTRTLNNVTLVGGMKAGKFTQLGTTDDMDLCKQRLVY